MKKFLLLGALLVQAAAVYAGDLYYIPVKTIDGQETTLAPYKGKVMFICNVASKCGTTPQYAPLEAAFPPPKSKHSLALL